MSCMWPLNQNEFDTLALEEVIRPVCPSLRRRIIPNLKSSQSMEENGSVSQKTEVSYMSVRQAEPEELHVYPGVQASTSNNNRPATLGSISENVIWNDWRQESSGSSHSQASCQGPCALSSEPYASSLVAVDARAGGQSLDLSQPSSSGTTDATFSSAQIMTSTHSFTNTTHYQRRQVSFTSPREEKNLSAANPVQGKKKELEVYEMKDDRRRGFCLIINNNDFSNSQKELGNEGTDVDEKSLVDVFEWLGFETQTERDCSEQRMPMLLEDLSKKDHTAMDCLVCCVLSHGKRGAVYGVDGGELPLRDLTGPFSGAHCATLREKPKLFFIQACQGRKEQLAVPIESDSPESGSAQDYLTTDALVPQDSIPDEADFLLGMATVPDFASFRDRKEGTWFIQSLCENLVLLVPGEHDLLSILTKVNDDVSRKTDKWGTKKQMPQPAFSLRKGVVFPVPQRPPPKIKAQAST
ncbi:hypothetical protein AAFF_G00254390 [Aldrovandia affinis]|uniref:Caspase-8 n=1 Tax=Aldrovandia affinis TaxID=143900 RepID=A0AAD7W2Y1_9TELE|nr:hypothetical protein AAFF_G00254390 [Aldrovandia affinis]